MPKKTYLIVGIVFLSILKLVFLKEYPIRYLGFEDISWLNLPGCNQVNTSPIDLVSEGLIVDSTSTKPLCATNKFRLLSSFLALEFSYDEKTLGKTNPYVLELLDESNKTVYQKVLPNTSQTNINKWNKLYFNIGEEFKDSYLKLRIRSEKLNLPKLYLRDRLEFLNRSVSTERINLFKFEIKEAIDLFVSLGFVLVAILLLPQLRGVSFFVLLSLVSVVLHLQYQPFFYYDEWHVLQRFSNISFPQNIILTHNEHFLPLYFLTLFIESKVFGEYYICYLILNCILLGGYAYILSIFLKELSINDKTAKILSLLFCISSMHVEALQWAFEASILICSMLCMYFLICSVRYFKTISFNDLLKANLCLLISPFVFGGAFPFLGIGVVSFFVYGLYYVKQYKNYVFSRASYLITVICSIAVPLYFYSAYKLESTGHAVDESSFFSDIPALFNYVLTGVGIGSILRPLGLYPFLSLAAPQELLDKLLNFNLSELNPLFFSSTVFFLAVTVLFFFSYVYSEAREKKRTAVIFSLGFFIVLFYITIVGLGRWRYGYNQSLSLRYQVQVLPGLILMIAPGVEHLITLINKNKWRYYALCLAVVLWSMIQFVSIQRFMYFRYNGDLNRIYVQSGVDLYDRNLVSNLKKNSIYPSHSDSITPGRNLSEIVKTYYWLKF